METLSSDDLRNLNEGILQLYSLQPLDTFSEKALSIVDRLVPGDVPEFHSTCLRTHQISSSFLPDFPGFTPEMQRVMNQYFGEHPIAQNMPRTLDGVYQISDFIDRQELYALEGLYQQFLRLLDTEDQIIFFLSPADPVSCQKLVRTDTTLVGFSTHRAWGKFSERDRLILKLLRPHLIQARANALHHHQLHQNLAQLQQSIETLTSALPNRIGLIVVDNQGQIQSSIQPPCVENLLLAADSVEPERSIDTTKIAAQAIVWLETYFAKSTGAGQLPDDLWAWVQHQVICLTQNPDLLTACVPFRIQQAGRELTIRLTLEPSGERYLLLLQEQTSLSLTFPAAWGLTPREHQILAAIMQGKGNKSIATELQISTSTVRKHLEHIYPKLGVQSRMEASALALTALGFLNGEW